MSPLARGFEAMKTGFEGIKNSLSAVSANTDKYKAQSIGLVPNFINLKGDTGTKMVKGVFFAAASPLILPFIAGHASAVIGCSVGAAVVTAVKNANQKKGDQSRVKESSPSSVSPQAPARPQQMTPSLNPVPASTQTASTQKNVPTQEPKPTKELTPKELMKLPPEELHKLPPQALMNLSSPELKKCTPQQRLGVYAERLKDPENKPREMNLLIAGLTARHEVIQELKDKKELTQHQADFLLGQNSDYVRELSKGFVGESKEGIEAVRKIILAGESALPSVSNSIQAEAPPKSQLKHDPEEVKLLYDYLSFDKVVRENFFNIRGDSYVAGRASGASSDLALLNNYTNSDFSVEQREGIVAAAYAYMKFVEENRSLQTGVITPDALNQARALGRAAYNKVISQGKMA